VGGDAGVGIGLSQGDRQIHSTITRHSRTQNAAIHPKCLSLPNVVCTTTNMLISLTTSAALASCWIQNTT